MSFTLQRKNRDQNLTIEILHVLYDELTPEEKEKVDLSNENHLLYMIAILFGHLGVTLPHGGKAPENPLQINFLYKEIVDAATTMKFNSPDFNTSKIFSQQGDRAFIAFCQDLLERLHAPK